MSEPIIFVVEDDPQVLSAIRRDLKDRYQGDYRILSAASGESAFETIKELKTRGDVIAMLITDQRMPGMQGVDLLAEFRPFYPVARRVLLTAYSDIKAAIRAINEVHLDRYLEKPWDPPEEHLYPAIDDLLSQWQEDYRPEVTGIRIVGDRWSPHSHALKDFLGSNLIPYRWLEANRDPEAQVLMEAANIRPEELPALVLETGVVLRNPKKAEVSGHLGLTQKAAHDLYDLVIVGAGPAGLAAAVYGASEGMRTLMLDGRGPGGQAGASSRIENYLGFPSGVSGIELTRRAVAQAQRLGAEFLTPVQVTRVVVEGGYKRLILEDGRELVARTVLAATGMKYREHTAEGIADRLGAGIYYGAATTEAHSCRGCRVMVVGGGNSAGQSAVYLSRFASEVHIVVRREGLVDSMSHYLIQQIEQAQNIRVRGRTEIERVEGDQRLQRVCLRTAESTGTSMEEFDALFVFIGTRPNTEWLPETVLRNEKGFVITGRDLLFHEAFPKVWKEDRDPLALETSIPGLFAAGDVRAGAMNRVASAVGEGSMVVRLAYDYLAHT